MLQLFISLTFTMQLSRNIRRDYAHQFAFIREKAPPSDNHLQHMQIKLTKTRHEVLVWSQK